MHPGPPADGRAGYSSGRMATTRSPDLERLLEKLARLRKLDPEQELFGASAHEYALALPVDEADLAAAEAAWGATLPDDYREFVTLAGGGGAGPGHGLFPLAKGQNGLEWDGDGASLTTDLTQPFPHTSAWNMEDHPIWRSQPDPDDQDAYDAWDEEFQALYWNAKWTVGAVCICHIGCALRYWLVVNGPERGHVWYDGTADRTGLEPCSDANGNRLTFTGWYEDWLDASLKKVGAG